MKTNTTVEKHLTERERSIFRSKMPFFQPKLSIGRPDDRYEKEADDVVEKVMRKPDQAAKVQPFFAPMPIPAVANVNRQCSSCAHESQQVGNEKEDEAEASSDMEKSLVIGSSEDDEGEKAAANLPGPAEGRLVQRKCAHCEEEETDTIIQRKADASDKEWEAPHVVNEALNSGGRTMDSNTLSFMETRFGYDFTNVRIHTDSLAARSADAIHALAYTSGNDVVFNEGQYSPSTDSGKNLIAHELTHVIQQRGAEVKMLQRAPEDETDTTSSKVAAEFIPTAKYSITVSGITFTVPPEATFSPGKKMPQLIRIVLKTLLKDQYDESLAEPVTAMLVKRGFMRSGHFASSKDAYKGEEIGPFYLEIDPFLAITGELKKRNLSVQISVEDEAKLERAFFEARLWGDFQRLSKTEGLPLPPWYSKPFFDFQIQQDPFQLDNYIYFAKEHIQYRDPLSKSKLIGAAAETFYAFYNQLAILDAIRKDTALAIHPETQLVYVSMWQMPDKSKRNKVPTYVGSYGTFTEFLKFAVKETAMFRDAETKSDMRISLLKKFQAEGNFKPDSVIVLPPFPSFIVAPDLNPDNSTITTAKNQFRMIVNFGALHGSGLHGVTVAMAMTLNFSWKVFPMPASLKALKENSGIPPETLVASANDFVKNSPANLGDPVKTYDPDDDRERTIAMKHVGIGDFVLMGLASPNYREDLKWVQQPSTAGYPFFVFDAGDLARMSAYSEWDALQSLKEQAKNATPDKRAELEKEIQRLESRESTDLLSITRQDLADTIKIRDTALRLKTFIEKDASKKLSREGNQSTDPFVIRLQHEDIDLFNLFIMVGQMFDLRVYGYIGAVGKFIDAVNLQVNDLTRLEKRTQGAYSSFKTIDDETPTFRTVAALVKEDDGNLVPLLMVAGYHPEADPKRGVHKIKLVDVTFDAPKKDKMIYVGSPVLDTSVTDHELSEKEKLDFKRLGTAEVSSESEAKRKAIDSAMVKFGDDNSYGTGKVLYRVPGTPFAGQVDSTTTAYEYLQMAIAALGLIVLIMGVIASAGLLTPAAVAVVTALGISVAVVGALMSGHNIGERQEKGTLEMDTEMALDIVNIVGAVAIGVGQIAKITITASRLSQVSKVMQLARLEKSLLLYDAVDFSANVFLVSYKVKEDIDAIKNMRLPKYMEDSMIAAVTFEAIQQGAIMAVGARGLGKQFVDYHRTKVETAAYKSLVDRGWIEIDADGKTHITENAPPFLREGELAGKTRIPKTDDQGQSARVQVEQEMLTTIKTHDGEHSLTLTERGRIIRCTDHCQDLRVKYEKEILGDAEMQQRLVDIETKAQEAAQTKNKQLEDETLAAAKELEADLASVERRAAVKSFNNITAPREWKKMRDYGKLLAKLQANNVSPGHLQDIIDNAIKNGESEVFVSTLYSALVEHEKSPMASFKKLIDGLSSTNEDTYKMSRALTERISIVRTDQKGAKQVDRLLGRFSMKDLVLLRKDLPSTPGSDVAMINALDSIISRTDEPSGKIIELVNKAASPAAPDKPDLLRLQSIMEGMPLGQRYHGDAIEGAIVRSNEFEAKVREAMADPKHGFDKMAQIIWEGNVKVDGKKVVVADTFAEGKIGSGEAAYNQIIGGGRGEKLASQIFSNGKIDLAKWQVIKDVINGSNIATPIKNSAVGEIWSLANMLKLKAEGYQVFREVKITDGTTQARADLVAIKNGEIRILECKAMAGGLSPRQKKIYPYLENNEFGKVSIIENETLNTMLGDPAVSKSFELVRDNKP